MCQSYIFSTGVALSFTLLSSLVHLTLNRFSSCHDLVLSRFCVADYRDYGVVGIKIHRVTRVHNRILRMQFDECLANIIEDEDNPYQGAPGVNTATGMPNGLMTNSRYVTGNRRCYLEGLNTTGIPYILAYKTSF